MIELYIENQLVDQSDKIDYSIEKSFFDASDPSKLCDNFSKTIKIPMTDKNRKLFGHWEVVDRWTATKEESITNTGIYFSPYLKMHFILKDCGQTIMEGDAKFTKCSYSNKDRNYEIQLIGMWNSVMYKLSTAESWDVLKSRYQEDLLEEMETFRFIRVGNEVSQYPFSQKWNLSPAEASFKIFPNVIANYYKNFESNLFVKPTDTLTKLESVGNITIPTAKEFRVDKLPIFKNTKAIFEELQSYLNGQLILDPVFFNNNNPYYTDTWTQLPPISSGPYVPSVSDFGGVTMDLTTSIPTQWLPSYSPSICPNWTTQASFIYPSVLTYENKTIDGYVGTVLSDTQTKRIIDALKIEYIQRLKASIWGHIGTHHGTGERFLSYRRAYCVDIKDVGLPSTDINSGYYNTMEERITLAEGCYLGIEIYSIPTDGTQLLSPVNRAVGIIAICDSLSNTKVYEYLKEHYDSVIILNGHVADSNNPDVEKPFIYNVDTWFNRLSKFDNSINREGLGIASNCPFITRGGAFRQIMTAAYTESEGQRINFVCDISKRVGDQGIYIKSSLQANTKIFLFTKMVSGWTDYDSSQPNNAPSNSRAGSIWAAKYSIPSVAGGVEVAPYWAYQTSGDLTKTTPLRNIYKTSEGGANVWYAEDVHWLPTNVVWNTEEYLNRLAPDIDNVGALILENTSVIIKNTISGFKYFDWFKNYLKTFNLKLEVKEGFTVVTTNDRLLGYDPVTREYIGTENKGIQIDYSSIEFLPNYLDSNFISFEYKDSEGLYNISYYNKQNKQYGQTKVSNFNEFAVENKPIFTSSLASPIVTDIAYIDHPTYTSNPSDSKLIQKAYATTSSPSVNINDQDAELMENEAVMVFETESEKVLHAFKSKSSDRMMIDGQYYYYMKDLGSNQSDTDIRMARGMATEYEWNADGWYIEGNMATTQKNGLDIHFSLPQTAYSSKLSINENDINDIQRIYHNYIKDLYGWETRICKCKALVNMRDFSYANLVNISGKKFLVTAIKNWKNQNELCDIEMVSVDNIDNYKTAQSYLNSYQNLQSPDYMFAKVGDIIYYTYINSNGISNDPTVEVLGAQPAEDYLEALPLIRLYDDVLIIPYRCIGTHSIFAGINIEIDGDSYIKHLGITE